jgi:hypothetical protein
MSFPIPTRLPINANTSVHAYNAGIIRGANNYNSQPWDPDPAPSLYSSKQTSPHTSDFNRGVKQGYNDAASSYLNNRGGTNRRKYRKTRKTMRKRSYRRRR